MRKQRKVSLWGVSSGDRPSFLVSSWLSFTHRAAAGKTHLLDLCNTNTTAGCVGTALSVQWHADLVSLCCNKSRKTEKWAVVFFVCEISQINRWTMTAAWIATWTAVSLGLTNKKPAEWPTHDRTLRLLSFNLTINHTTTDFKHSLSFSNMSLSANSELYACKADCNVTICFD